MVRARYQEIEAKSVLNRVRGMGFRWSINPYRGCVHGCHYCFARVTHTYFDLNAGEDFSSIIFVKVNAPQVLRAELARPSWRREVVSLGTATDPYQPIEGRYRLTRRILEALCEFRTPVGVVTKSPMPVRDLDVLTGFRGRARCTVYFSVTTLDEGVWRQLEPGTAPPWQRLRAMARLAAAGVRTGALLAPIVPGITATRANLESVVRAAAEHGARFVGPSVLNLSPEVKRHFFAFLEREYPRLLPRYRQLYPGRYAPPSYAAQAEGLVHALQARYLLPRRGEEPESSGERADLGGRQLVLAL